MKATIFEGKDKIVVKEVPNPKIEKPTDAIVKVVYACVCGSDLWFYRGISDHPHNSVGHEMIGVVDEIGDEVKDIKVGDFVIMPFADSCGKCPACKSGYQTACVEVGFMGNGDEEFPGMQAEYVRVQNADGSLYATPDKDFTDDQLKSLLTLSDVMGTGYHAAHEAQVKDGDTVAVVGDGAVGLCGVISAKLLGAKRVIMLGSTHEPRHELAKKFGADEIITARGDEAVKELMKLTYNVGADAVLECVGTNDAYETAFAVARPGAIVGRVGVPHDATIDAEGTFFRNIGVRGGPAPVRAYVEELYKAVMAGDINPGEVFDYEVPLDDIAKGYEAMDNREAIKSLVKVSDYNG